MSCLRNSSDVTKLLAFNPLEIDFCVWFEVGLFFFLHMDTKCSCPYSDSFVWLIFVRSAPGQTVFSILEGTMGKLQADVLEIETDGYQVGYQVALQM